MKEKIEELAFSYLIGLKNSPGREGKMSKIANIQYERLELQQYLSENKNTKISKLIAQARAKTLEIKTHKSWKYEDKLCAGCEIKVWYIWRGGKNTRV